MPDETVVNVDLDAEIVMGDGAYRVEQVVGDIRMAFQAPSKEEALQMAGVAVDPAVFIWDAKVVSSQELDEYIFAGWEPCNAFPVPTGVNGTTIMWAIRKKVHKPSGPIGIVEVPNV